MNFFKKKIKIYIHLTWKGGGLCIFEENIFCQQILWKIFCLCLWKKCFSLKWANKCSESPLCLKNGFVEMSQFHCVAKRNKTIWLRNNPPPFKLNGAPLVNSTHVHVVYTSWEHHQPFASTPSKVWRLFLCLWLLRLVPSSHNPYY